MGAIAGRLDLRGAHASVRWPVPRPPLHRPPFSLRCLPLLGILVGCQNGASLAQPPPLYPRDLPVPLEPPRLQNLGLPRAALQQTTILSPKLRAAAQSDEFTQTQALLDVLWVVSNVGAMADERDRLAKALPAFTNILTAAKDTWQLAVTSSDLSVYQLSDGTLHVGDGGKLHGPTPLLSLLDPNYQSDFAAALTWAIVRNSAPSQTSLFESMKLALDAATPSGANAGLLRPGAALAVIGAANSDDQSFGEVGYFARYLKGLKGKGNEELITFSALGGPANGGCTPPGQESIFGAHVDPTPRLQQLAKATSGVFESICDEAGFQGSLQQIALNIKTLRRYFPLSAPPDPSSIAVLVNGQAVGQDAQAGWQYLANINSVAFLGSYVPNPGADVKINYAVSKL